MNLARIKNVEKNHIEVLASLFQQSLGYEPSLLYLLNTSKNPYTLRQSAAIFNKFLSKTDKLKLFLNIFYLAYIEESFHVLTSLEIIKIMDLMHIEVNLYDQILDIIENKNNCFDFDVSLFKSDFNKRIIHNDILLNSSLNRDYLLKNADFTVLHIRDKIFIATETSDTCKLNNSPLEPDKFYILNKNDEVTILIQNKGTFNIEVDDFLKLSKRRWKLGKYNYIIEEQEYKAAVSIDKLNCKVKILSSFTLYPDIKTSKKLIFALDDLIYSPELKIVYTGWDFLVGKQALKQDISLNKEITLFNTPDGLSTNNDSAKTKAATANVFDEAVMIIPEIQEFSLNNKNQPSAFIVKINEQFKFKNHSYYLNQYFQLIKVSYDIKDFIVHEIYHEFSKGQKIALDNINFSLKRCEMLAIMGPSGSGKTTLLKCLLGEIIPNRSSITIDNENFNPANSIYSKNIAYVPQDDLLFENLTIYQNLYYCAKIRMPEINNKAIINDRIKHILSIMGLWEKKDLTVGSVNKKSLSGGERKRLNVALELLSDPKILILDEPTSGLSSKDSEKLIQTLNNLKLEGKIILATIHQPNPDIFQSFDKLLLLDKGGVQVYFGPTSKIFNYVADKLPEVSAKDKLIVEKKNLKMPDYIFDVLEFSETSNITGLSERKFLPVYWKEKYRKNKIFELIHFNNSQDNPNNLKTSHNKTNKTLHISQKIKKNYYLFLRNFINKISNQANIMINLIAAPILALAVSFILRFANNPDSQSYSFYNNPNIGLFIFISIIIFIFFGMANAINEIISEKRILCRERKINLKNYEYFNVKITYLAILSAIQTILYLLASSSVLHIKGMLLPYFIFLFLSAMSGSSIGLLLSALFKDNDSATSIMPYILIPQIIFAGAVINFSDMNPNIKINKHREVPEFCDLISSRWLFEGLAVSQTQSNYYDKNVKKITNEIKNCRDNQTRNLLYSELNKFSSENPKELFINKQLNNWNFIQNGKALNNHKYIYMSSSRTLIGKKIPLSLFNALYALFLLIITSILTLLALKKIKD